LAILGRLMEYHDGRIGFRLAFRDGAASAGRDT
jgi:hypothetical protein